MDEIQLTDNAGIIRPYKLSDITEVFSAVQESIAQISPWDAMVSR